MSNTLPIYELLKSNNNWTIGTNNSVLNIISNDASINNLNIENGILNNNKTVDEIILEDNSNNKLLNFLQISNLIKTNINEHTNAINNLNKSSIIKQVIKKNNLSLTDNSIFFTSNDNNSYILLKYNILYDFSLLSQLELVNNENGDEYHLTKNKNLYIKLRRILINKYGNKISDKYISINKVGLYTNIGGFINSYSNTFIDYPNHNYKIFYKLELYNSKEGIFSNISSNLLNNIIQDGFLIISEFKNEVNNDGYVKQIIFKQDISLNSDISNNYNNILVAEDYNLEILPKYNNSKLLLNYNLNYLSSLYNDQSIQFYIKKIQYISSDINETIIDSSSIISSDLLKISNGFGEYSNIYNYSYLDNIKTKNKIKYELLYELIIPTNDLYNNQYTNSYGILGIDQSFSNTISIIELNENNGIELSDVINETSNNIINSIYRYNNSYLYKQISYKNLSNNIDINDYYITINPQLENSTIYLTFNINFLLSFYSDNLVNFSIYKDAIDLLSNENIVSNQLVKSYNNIGSKNANAYFTNKLNFELYDNNNNNYNLIKYYLQFEFQNSELINHSIMSNNSNFILAYEI